MSDSPQELFQVAQQLGTLLESRSQTVVFAESCTAGLISATLARIPGISRYLCGSAVVYQEATKKAWLGVSELDLANPAVGAVSQETAEAMVLGVLERTPQADWAASVTGHLGPQAPNEFDGVIFIGLARRSSDTSLRLIGVHRVQLPRQTEDGSDLRIARQWMASQWVLELLTEAIEGQYRRV